MILKDGKTDFHEVDRIVARIGGDRSHTIQLLQAIQDQYHYLPVEVLNRVCETTDITPARIVGVSTFYNQFRFKPAGEHLIRVCHGTACHVKRSPLVHESFQRHLQIPEDADTDPDGTFTIEKVACLGCCTLAPVVQVDDSFYGYLAPDKVSRILRDFMERKESSGTSAFVFGEGSPENGDAEIRIGLGSCCAAKGSDRLRTALEEELDRIGARATVKRVGCVGMCHRTPLVEVVLPGRDSVHYASVGPDDARAIVTRHFKPAGLFKRFQTTLSVALDHLLQDEETEPISRYSIDFRENRVAAFLDKQVHIATEHFGCLNPFDLEEYKRFGGFEGFVSCIERRSPVEVIEEIQASGLRGRGGGGYHTGLKWAKVREAEGDPKYVICNGDEGDPGAFMDRMLLESFPYRVIEGMLIAAYAVGAREGLFYVRSEYPLALRVIREAIRRCEEAGLLGENILGSGLSFRLRVAEGAGAFVSGEETALLASVEGRRSMPSLRPPYPAEHGLWGKPTSINNVETYSVIPWILRHGGEMFARLGTETSKGTKVFALAGKVARGGLVEVPMGMTLREIVEEIGGGIEGGGRFKAVQVGGPSGGCIPAQLADTPIDFEALKSVGAIMGSGGLVVLDDRDCMVDMARYFLEFTQIESCGKCTFCRIGTKRMLEIMTRLCEGKAAPGDLDRLERLALDVKKAAFCGLGKTAPNPVLTTLQYFHEEYEAHLEGSCPAGKCKALVRYSITDDCTGCTICRQHCPVDAIESVPYQVHRIDNDKCIRCDMCRIVCPEDTVRVV